MERVSLGEDSTVEFKEAPPHRHSLSDELAAFANGGGGTLLMGVRDDGRVVGLSGDQLQKAEKLVVEVSCDSIDPEIQISTEKFTVGDATVLCVQVPRSYFVHKSANGYMMRQGSSKREMSHEYLARLIQQRSQARFKEFAEYPVPDTGMDSLHPPLYRRFIGTKWGLEGFGEGAYGGNPSEAIDQHLHKRKILVDADGVCYASVGGVLMCSEEPREHLNNSYICAVCYKGTRRDADDQIDAQDFTGPLDEQVLDAYKFASKHNQVSARKKIARYERPQYSSRAIFEALVNAVAHRDYYQHRSKIRLFIFADRLEIYSPGALLNGLTVDNIPYNQVTRNELLARLLSELRIKDEQIQRAVLRYNFMERRGEGVPIILSESEKLSGKRPLYQLHGEQLCLTIYAAPSLQDERDDRE